MQLINKGDVWLIEYGMNAFPIGRIKQDTLILDSPSRIRSTAYGIDQVALTSHLMDYHFIQLRHGKEDWVTSRKFWEQYGYIKDLGNGRTEKFLKDALFGADKAILYEQYIEPEVQELIKKDIFDIAQGTTGWEDPQFKAWERAIDIEVRFKESMKYKQKIAL